MQGRLQYISARVRSFLLVMGFTVAVNLGNATLPARVSHDRPEFAGNPAQLLDNPIPSGATVSEVPVPGGSQDAASPRTVPRAEDEIGTKLRFLSTCVTIGLVLFTLGVIGLVTFNPSDSA